MKTIYPSELRLYPFTKAVWCTGACIVLILCTSCSFKVNEDDMLEAYEQIVEVFCDAQVVCRSLDVEIRDIAKSSCKSVFTEHVEDYAAVPECKRYKKIHMALVYKCQVDFVKKYGEAFCDGMVDDPLFPGMAQYCHLKYTSNANAFGKKAIDCACRHLDVYQKSDLPEYKKIS